MSRGIPKTVKIGEVEYSVAEHPELLALVEAGRTEEKTKLYARIEKAENEVKSLTDEKAKSGEITVKQKADLDKALQELEEAKTKLSEFIKKEGEEPSNVMTPEEIKKMVADAVAGNNKESETKIAELQEQLKQRDLASYRERKLAEVKDIVIPDFVPTSLTSNEDIDKAIEEAKAKSANYLTQDFKFEDGTSKRLTLHEIANLTDEEKKGSGTPPPATPPTTPTSTTPPVETPPTPPAGGGNPPSLMDSLKDMSDADYEKNRDAIKQEVMKLGVNNA